MGLTDVVSLLKHIGDTRQYHNVWRWLRSLRRNYLLDEGMPWISFDAIDYIKARLRSQPRVFEYGSGGSTIFWLKQGATLISVEHDRAWYNLISARLGQHPGLDYRLVNPVRVFVEKQGDPGDPSHYATKDTMLQEYSFEAYVRQIDSFPDLFFDVVLVDGRSRPACIAHGARKVRTGGLLVLDNADRDYYTAQIQEHLRGFVRRSFTGLTPATWGTTRTDCFWREAPSEE